MVMRASLVVRPANWFTRAPKNYSHTEGATLTTAGPTAWRALVSDGPLKAGENGIDFGYGRCVDIRPAVRKNDGRIDDRDFVIR